MSTLPRLWRRRHEQARRGSRPVPSSGRCCLGCLAAGPGVPGCRHWHGHQHGRAAGAAWGLAPGSRAAAFGQLLGRNAGLAEPDRRKRGASGSRAPRLGAEDRAWPFSGAMSRSHPHRTAITSAPSRPDTTHESLHPFPVSLFACCAAGGPRAVSGPSIGAGWAKPTRPDRKQARRSAAPARSTPTAPFWSRPGSGNAVSGVEPLPYPWRASCTVSGRVQARSRGRGTSRPEGCQQPVRSARR